MLASFYNLMQFDED